MDYTSDALPSPTVSDAVTSRRSLRAFKDTPVDSMTVRQILDTAARAPSGTNMQPWRAYVLEGAQLARTVEAIHADFDAGVAFDSEEKYYPDTFFEPYLTRRRTVGLGLYKLLGLARENREGMAAQHRRNFQFFDAPVGMVFTIDRRLNTGSWLDYGMFLQNIMLLAREAGLHTCPQAAFCGYHAALRRTLPIPDTETVVCGLSMGYATLDDPANQLVTERAPLSDWATFLSD